MAGREDVTAIVLAGGRSARFGGPKLEATIDGETLLARALRAVDHVAATIVVAGPEPPNPPPLVAALRAIPDDEPFGGPLVALSGALRLASTELAIVVGGDMPALVPSVLRMLLDRLHSHGEVDAAILEAPVDAEKARVLPLAVRVGPASAAASAAIDAGDRSLARLLGRVRCVAIPAADWRGHDPEARTLLDVDAPADLRRLRGNENR